MGYDRAERVFRALGSRSRLRILECLRRDVTNPGEIARELKRPRATIEKHLRVLVTAEVIEKVPSLSKSGNLTIRYRVRANAESIVEMARELAAST